MTKLIVLGSSSAVPNLAHENTHFVLVGEKSSVLIDCVGNQLLRLERAGVNLDTLNDIILTHCHPDHISGIPSLLMSLWLMGRRLPLKIHGLEHTLNCVEKMMALFEWQDWPGFFPVSFQILPADEMFLVLENEEIRIFSSPVEHLLPTIGLRFESPQTGKSIAYSCDTEPSNRVAVLGKDADILLHEASGQSSGHSSAAQAGEVADRAGAKALYLIHYPPDLFGSQNLLADAAENYSGDIRFAADFMELEL